MLYLHKLKILNWKNKKKKSSQIAQIRLNWIYGRQTSLHRKLLESDTLYFVFVVVFRGYIKVETSILYYSTVYYTSLYLV